MRWFAGWLYFLGLITVVIGATLYLVNEPEVPTRAELVEYKGFLRSVRLEKALDGTDLVYLHFQDDDRRYAYIAKFPLYVEIRDRLGIFRDVELLIDAEAANSAATDGTLMIWGLLEHDPYHEGTKITYEEIYDEVTETDRGWQNVGIYTTLCGLFALVVGFTIRRLIPYVPKNPTA
tara:strand:+ start:8876 stop:9406 length:531 start_codon:yes stop_codon:yes gene_type:complete